MADIVANALYMAPNGKDSNTGTIDSPLASINGAISKGLGTSKFTLYVRSGEYTPTKQTKLNFQCKSTNPLVIQKYPNDTGNAKFNLEKFPVDSVSNGAFIFASSASNITIDGLEVYNNSGHNVVQAFVFEGLFSNIIIQNCYVHDLSGSKKGTAVALSCTSTTTYATGCKVLNCRIENMTTGTSEAVRVTGMNEGAEVAYNSFDKVSNIAVLANNARTTGQTKNVHIHHNSFSNQAIVHNTDPGAVYIDGGIGTIVEDNTFNKCRIAVIVTCEVGAKIDVTGNVVRNNKITNCTRWALQIGTWNSAVTNDMHNNTFYNNIINHTSSLPVIHMYKTSGVTFDSNNITTTSALVISGRNQANAFAKSGIVFTNNKIYKTGADDSSKLFSEVNGTATSMTLAKFITIIKEGTGNSINPSKPPTSDVDEENIFITLANLRVFKEKLLEEINKSKS